MAQIIPIRDLKNTAAISELCKSSGEPIFITKNGYGDMVIMDMEIFNKTMARLYVYDKLREAETELKSGAVGKPANEVLSQLRMRHEEI